MAIRIGQHSSAVVERLTAPPMRSPSCTATTRLSSGPASAVHCWSSPVDSAIHPDHKGFNSRAIIDATRPYEWRDRFPKAARVSRELERRMLDKWGAAFFAPVDGKMGS